MVIIYFSPLNRFGSKPVHSKVTDVKKMTDLVNKSVLSKSVNNERLSHIYKYVKTMAEANTCYKFGDLIAQILERNNLLNKNSSSMELLSFNTTESFVGKQTIYRTTAQIGTKPGRKMQKLQQGPVLEKHSREMLNSEKDCLKPSNRPKLKFVHGINQRCYCFLSENTFIPFREIKNLTDYDKEHEESLTKNLHESILRLTNQEPPIDDIKRFSPDTTRRITDFYSAILKTELELRLINNTPGYSSNVTIHLVEFKQSAIERNASTINRLTKNLQYEEFNKEKDKESLEKASFRRKYFIERLNPADLKHVSNNNKYTKQLITTLNCNITRLEAFKRDVKVLKSWTRNLSSKSKWDFNLTTNFRKGVLLNKIHELDHDGICEDTPIQPFLIIETYGDPRGSGIRLEDDEEFNNFYTATQHQFDVKLRVHYLAKPDNPDEIHMFKETRKDTEFLSREKSIQYYPEREEKFNINFENIKLSSEGKKKKGAKYQFIMNTSPIEENKTIIVTEEIIKNLKKFPENKNVSNDDLTFINTENITNSTNETNNDLPYGEFDEH